MRFETLFSLKKELELFKNITNLFENQKDGYFLYTFSENEFKNLEKSFSTLEELRAEVFFTEEPHLISVKDESETYITLSGKDYFICHTKENGTIRLFHFNENKKETDKIENSIAKKTKALS